MRAGLAFILFVLYSMLSKAQRIEGGWFSSGKNFKERKEKERREEGRKKGSGYTWITGPLKIMGR